eukprot:CAMPEP_0196232398 /NCGR_PEP_ID=MMETSP0913-20130531/3037_1 /TAXON_ID=49265 /ORGANISM="Thalassiosira rotula, Strain GSO102" /LENGTH=66 /DNA_ID=CAMNT_0041512891 /DNA_START=208 /DNA_END=408 /DNA_ORIENTATION=-
MTFLAPFIVPPMPACSSLASWSKAPSSSMVVLRVDTRSSSCDMRFLVRRREVVMNWAWWVADVASA